MTDEDERYDTRDEALEAVFFDMEPGDTVGICTKGKGCAGAEDPACPDCKSVERLLGDTLQTFLRRCAWTN